MAKTATGQLSLLDIIPIAPAGHGKDPSRVQLPLVPEPIAAAIVSGAFPQIEQPSVQTPKTHHDAPSLEKESPRFKVGERVRVKGIAEAGPVYHDNGGNYVWVCFGLRATPHDRADVTPEKVPTIAPAPVKPVASVGSKLWHQAGLDVYQRLRDRFLFLITSEPYASANKTAMRQHMVAHLNSLLTQLTEV